MANKEHHLIMARELETVETGLAMLYTLYAERLTAYQDFWKDLAAAERTHALMMQTLQELIEKNQIIYGERKFSLRAIQYNSEVIRAQIVFTERNPVAIREALHEAMQFENLLIEKNLFEIQDGDSEQLKQTLASLLYDTRIHLVRVTQLYNQLGHP